MVPGEGGGPVRGGPVRGGRNLPHNGRVPGPAPPSERSGRFFDPSRGDFAPYGFECQRWTPKVMPRANRHNEIELNILRSGSTTYLCGGRRVRMLAGRMSAFWAAIPHQLVEVASDEDYYVVHLPLAWFLQAGMPEVFVARLLRGEVVTEPDVGRGDADWALFARWAEDLAADGELARRVVLLELEARLLRLAAATTPGARRATVERAAANKVEAMAMFLAGHYTEKLPVERIAAEVGLHPNYAMTLFRRSFGVTLVEYLTQMRVSHAQRLLATTDAKILEVALSSGFHSLSRFNEAFVRICGSPPSRYRARHRGPS